MGLSGPIVMVPEPVSQPSAATNVPFRPSPLKFLSSSSAVPKSELKPDSQQSWTADFLTDLRTNRPARPSGSRPLPNRNATSTPVLAVEPPTRSTSALSRPFCSTQQTETTRTASPERSASAMAHRRTHSAFPGCPTGDNVGRPLVQQPHRDVIARDFSEAAGQPPIVPPSAIYRESGQRWMEKQEARSLREALEDMDMQEDERLHAAAQDEASELVWKHRNPGVPYRNPSVPHDYKQHLRKGSYARSQSIGRYPSLGITYGPQVPPKRSVSDSTTSSQSDSGASHNSRVSSGSSMNKEKVDRGEDHACTSKGHAEWDSPKKKAYMNLRSPEPPINSFNHRRNSGTRSRVTSGEAGKGLFRNPNDQIYEEPEDLGEPQRIIEENIAKPGPLRTKNRNSSLKIQDAKGSIDRFPTTSTEEPEKISRFEIHKNPPSQSRNPSYVQNTLPPTPPDSASASDTEACIDKPAKQNGVEVRSDEIRAATSMRLKDRSPKLPTPTVVSDRPGRPIVSFDRGWRAREVVPEHHEPHSSRSSSQEKTKKIFPVLPGKPHLPPSTASAPVIPTIHVLEAPTIEVNSIEEASSNVVPEVPSISISSPAVPVISTPDSTVSPRPLPSPATRARPPHGHRPAPHHSSTAPVPSTKSHWSPFSRRATAQCAACALPISGRIVSAASQRFHPECFTCFQCGELLECVAFYPEPTDFRSSRIARIEARINGQEVPKVDGKEYTEEDDGDNSLRFYCHLDFHENFSPRCRSCKTPIEGEVVLACGGEWHVGHFFCAECGDPFDANTPFVEKNGYAWSAVANLRTAASSPEEKGMIRFACGARKED
ncbi:hypothetical protein MMC24_000281 [Lignoscripta atroalba]|nr:hypothetical protein [Lignoscripta atroalba]